MNPMKTNNPIKALVLAGGSSKRMGTDKARITYYQKEQMYHVADMLIAMGLSTYISLNSNQNQDLDSSYSFIFDTVERKGPLGGICAAFATDSSSAWIVVGCDYPLIQRFDLQHLLYQSKIQHQSVAYFQEESQLFYPTLAVYQAQIQSIFQQALKQDELKLQSVLAKAKVSPLKPLNSIRFVSANTPEIASLILNELKNEERNTSH